jgi:uncharacterized membrane protein YgcG
MHRSIILRFICISTAILAVCFACISQPSNAKDLDRKFPIPTGFVTDFAQALSVTEIESLTTALESANEATGLDGRVIIAASTDEWYLNEYAKDYCSFLQAEGIIKPTGWLIYLSTDDKKFALSVQDRALGVLTPVRRREIELILNENLKNGGIASGLDAAIKAIGDLPPQRTKQPTSKKSITSPSNLIFFGLAIILLTIATRARRMAKIMNRN